MTRMQRILRAVMPDALLPPMPSSRGYADPEWKRQGRALPELCLAGDPDTAPDYEHLLADLQRDHEHIASGRRTPDDRRMPAIARIAEARLAHCLLDDDYLRRLRSQYLRDQP